MTSERIEPGAEQAHRDDLARDVARLWMAHQRTAPDASTRELMGAWDALGAALDLLAVSYDFNADA